MNTTLIDNAIDAAVAAATISPVAIPHTPVSGWPEGTVATVSTEVYVTLHQNVRTPGFVVCGKIQFPNGYVATRLVNVGPYSPKGNKDWPTDIEKEAEDYGKQRAKKALDTVASVYPQDQQTALLMKWTSVVAAGTQSSHPLLAAVEAWIAGVTAAALNGSGFPPPPGTSFVDLMAE